MSSFFGHTRYILLGLAMGATPAPRAVPRPALLCGVAQPRKRPPGAPKHSDVVMRSLRLHPANPKDPHDTFAALRAFHVTRLEWAYIHDAAFIAKVKASGRLFGAAAAAPSYDKDIRDDAVFGRVVIRGAGGRPITAPWKRQWKRTLWGCVNNPELERGYLAYLKRCIDAGSQVIHRDEPGANASATRWGGCFCEHCVKAFRGYLSRHTTARQRERLGIGDVRTFDCRRHVQRAGAKGELGKLFAAFQLEATVAFHRRTRRALDAYAGRHVPMSCNNGVRRWSEVERCFDWAFGELSMARATPVRLWQAVREARKHNRLQVMTMPKKGDRREPEAWCRRTRRTIATAYALGAHCMVPWDVYMPNNAPRYFGTPRQYADLYGFVRACARHLDGYEDAGALGAGLADPRHGKAPPIEVVGGSGKLYAFARAVPGAPDAPVVVHLVEWGDKPAAATVRLRGKCLFAGAAPSVVLLVPPAYDARSHDAAEKAGRFAALAKVVPVRAETDGDSTWTGVAVPPLGPWGILVARPSR